MKSQSYTKNYRQLRNAESRRNSPTQRRTHQLVIHTKCSALKTNVQVVLDILKMFYLHI
ncbi:hypothetical protein LEMLEM_LOCUS23841 [Lemmus lemmus]